MGGRGQVDTIPFKVFFRDGSHITIKLGAMSNFNDLHRSVVAEVRGLKSSKHLRENDPLLVYFALFTVTGESFTERLCKPIDTVWPITRDFKLPSDHIEYARLLPRSPMLLPYHHPSPPITIIPPPSGKTPNSSRMSMDLPSPITPHNSQSIGEYSAFTDLKPTLSGQSSVSNPPSPGPSLAELQQQVAMKKKMKRLSEGGGRLHHSSNASLSSSGGHPLRHKAKKSITSSSELSLSEFDEVGIVDGENEAHDGTPIIGSDVDSDNNMGNPNSVPIISYDSSSQQPNSVILEPVSPSFSRVTRLRSGSVGSSPSHVINSDASSASSTPTTATANSNAPKHLNINIVGTAIQNMSTPSTPHVGTPTSAHTERSISQYSKIDPTLIWAEFLESTHIVANCPVYKARDSYEPVYLAALHFHVFAAQILGPTSIEKKSSSSSSIDTSTTSEPQTPHAAFDKENLEGSSAGFATPRTFANLTEKETKGLKKQLHKNLAAFMPARLQNMTHLKPNAVEESVWLAWTRLATTKNYSAQEAMSEYTKTVSNWKFNDCMLFFEIKSNISSSGNNKASAHPNMVVSASGMKSVFLAINEDGLIVMKKDKSGSSGSSSSTSNLSNMERGRTSSKELANSSAHKESDTSNKDSSSAAQGLGAASSGALSSIGSSLSALTANFGSSSSSNSNNYADLVLKIIPLVNIVNWNVNGNTLLLEYVDMTNSSAAYSLSSIISNDQSSFFNLMDPVNVSVTTEEGFISNPHSMTPAPIVHCNSPYIDTEQIQTTAFISVQADTIGRVLFALLEKLVDNAFKKSEFQAKEILANQFLQHHQQITYSKPDLASPRHLSDGYGSGGGSSGGRSKRSPKHQSSTGQSSSTANGLTSSGTSDSDKDAPGVPSASQGNYSARSSKQYSNKDYLHGDIANTQLSLNTLHNSDSNTTGYTSSGSSGRRKISATPPSSSINNPSPITPHQSHPRGEDADDSDQFAEDTALGSGPYKQADAGSIDERTSSTNNDSKNGKTKSSTPFPLHSANSFDSATDPNALSSLRQRSPSLGSKSYQVPQSSPALSVTTSASAINDSKQHIKHTSSTELKTSNSDDVIASSSVTGSSPSPNAVVGNADGPRRHPTKRKQHSSTTSNPASKT